MTSMYHHHVNNTDPSTAEDVGDDDDDDEDRALFFSLLLETILLGVGGVNALCLYAINIKEGQVIAPFCLLV
jgi:hypothetical protein